MRRSGFRQQSIEEVRTKQAAKIALRRATSPATGFKAKKGSKSKKKVKTQAQLKKELDTIFSIYIRQKYADSEGNVECYTCRKIFHWKKIQNGHFISRSYLATRFHENNCRPQCVGDNIFGNGKPLDFEERLKQELGADLVEKMKASRHISLKLDRHWYTAEIAKYKLLIT